MLCRLPAIRRYQLIRLSAITCYQLSPLCYALNNFWKSISINFVTVNVCTHCCFHYVLKILKNIQPKTLATRSTMCPSMSGICETRMPAK